MVGMIDPSVLLGARGIQLPDPLALATQTMTLADLANRKRMHEYQMAQLQRQDEAAQALQGALPGAMQAGFTDDAIMRADPRAQQALLGMAEKYRKAQADEAKTRAETDSARALSADRGAQTKERLLKLVGGNAFELSNRPDLTLDHVGQFVEGARGVGVDVATLGGMPQDASPAGLRTYMRRIADLSVGAADKIRFAGDAEQRGEARRSNQAREAETARGHDLTATVAREGHEVTRAGQLLADARAREANAAALQGTPQEITVDGRPVLAIYDRRTGTFFDANTRAPVGGKIAPKENDMPASLREKMAQNEVTLSKIDRAIALAEQKPDAFGYKNYLPDAIRQRTDPEGVEARALVSDIAGQKIHDRSGAAVTVGEMERLKPYVPKTNDSPEAIKEKLRLFRAEYAALQDEIAKGRSLVDMISVRRGATADFGAPSAPALGEVRDGYRFRGGNPADPKSWERAR